MPDQPKNPAIVKAWPLAITGATSAGVGDQLGDALSTITVWALQLNVSSPIPASVTSALHTIFVFAVVVGAMALHIQIAKPKDGG